LTLLLNTVFLQPISGIITFLTFLRKLNTSLGLTAILTKVGSAGMFSFGGAIKGVIPAVIGLTKTLGVMLIGFTKILVVVGLVAGVIYGIGKLLGIGFKMPSMPTIKLPTYPKLKPTEYAPGESPEELTEADEEAAKKKEKALTKELRDKKKAMKKEMEVIDDGIDAYEKVRDAEIKARQKLVDEQEDALYERRELWEDERRIEEEKIRGQEETLKVVQKALKAAKKSLKGLQDARDDELDVAENGVDYAEMNLKAAQEALEREKLLGHDEFDASFRAAEARVIAAEEALKLALENEIKVKIAWQKQIDAQENIVDAAEDQVNLQSDALDDLKNALAERRAIVEKEVDVLQDELKIRQDALNYTREATQDKLDLMKEEKDVRQKAWDDEIEILQDRLDDARDQSADIASRPQPELPDVAGSWQAINDELEKQYNDLQGTIGASLKMGPGIIPGGLLDRMLKTFDKAKKQARENGKGVILAFLLGLSEASLEIIEPFERLLFDTLFGKGTWDTLKAQAEKEGKSTSEYLWDGTIKEIREFPQRIKKAILDFLFGRNVWEALNTKAEEQGKSVSQYLWDGIIKKIKEFPENVKKSIEENIINPIKRMFPKLYAAGEGSGEETKKGLEQGGKGTGEVAKKTLGEYITSFIRKKSELNQPVEDVKKKIRSIDVSGESRPWGKNIIQNFINGLSNYGGILNIFNNIRTSIWNTLNNIMGNMWAWGSNIINTFINGLNNYGGMWNVLNNIGGTISYHLSNIAGSAWHWGYNIVENLRRGIESARGWLEYTINSISNLVNRYWGAWSPPKEGPLKDIDEWGKNLVKIYADSMTKGMPYLEGAIGNISGSLGTSFAGGASTAIPAAKSAIIEQPVAGPVTYKTYEIKPGVMIASRGEVRNFVRMLKEYDQFEEDR